MNGQKVWTSRGAYAQLGAAARPARPVGAEAPRHHRVRARPARRRRRRPTAAPDERRRALHRGVPRRRARCRRRSHRRGRRRLAGRAHVPVVRAGRVDGRRHAADCSTSTGSIALARGARASRPIPWCATRSRGWSIEIARDGVHRAPGARHRAGRAARPRGLGHEAARQPRCSATTPTLAMRILGADAALDPRRRVADAVPHRAVDLDPRRHRRDPAQHRRRAGARPARGAARRPRAPLRSASRARARGRPPAPAPRCADRPGGSKRRSFITYPNAIPVSGSANASEPPAPACPNASRRIGGAERAPEHESETEAALGHQHLVLAARPSERGARDRLGCQGARRRRPRRRTTRRGGRGRACVPMPFDDGSSHACSCRVFHIWS